MDPALETKMRSTYGLWDWKGFFMNRFDSLFGATFASLWDTVTFCLMVGYVLVLAPKSSKHIRKPGLFGKQKKD